MTSAPAAIPIPHEGKKPDWLEDDEMIWFRAPDRQVGDVIYGNEGANIALYVPWASKAEGYEFHLGDYDHWATPVLAAGLTPWNSTLQGEGPPKNYAGGKVLTRGSPKIFDAVHIRWTWHYEPNDIIGYEPAPANPPTPPPPSVEALLEKAVAALRPFAEFDDGRAPEGLMITAGSAMARRQLTIADCRRARATLAEIEIERSKL